MSVPLSVWLRILRLGASIALVAALTWFAFQILHVNALIVGFAYVLVVLVIAARWGLTESLVTSVVAMFCLNYFFLPPILSLTIADLQNWVALFVFLVTSVTASKLSATARNRAAEAQARRIEVDHLYHLSLSLMLIDTTNDLSPQLAAAIKKQFGFDTVAFCNATTAEIHFAGVGQTAESAFSFYLTIEKNEGRFKRNLNGGIHFHVHVGHQISAPRRCLYAVLMISHIVNPISNPRSF